MSSLGYQQIARLIDEQSDIGCERVMLPDAEACARGRHGAPHTVPAAISYEELRPLSAFPVIALSVAYELELVGVVQLLEGSGIPALRRDRGEEHPFVLGGGPLTFSNPVPLGVFADAVVIGEADSLALEVLRTLRELPRARALAALAAIDGVWVPEIHGEVTPPVAKADDALLPARSIIRAPDTELSNMFLIETERGCSRGCAYCVMRRSTNGGMRIVPAERVLELIPKDARRVGLVGAAVSDHPKIVAIIDSLVERGAEVGLSSLRPDRLSEAFVGALGRAGYRTLTTAMDGPSERMREALDRRARVRHLERAAELARAHGMKRLKLYLMLGLPGETEADVDECVAFVGELSKRIPIALGIAPFCPKRNTPLSEASFAGIELCDRHLDRLRRGLAGRADVRATSARFAWAEAVLAKGGFAEGEAVHRAVRAGARFADLRKAFEAVEAARPKRRQLSVLDAVTGTERLKGAGGSAMGSA